jgi:sec-independent protein translocase protein TatB
MLNIGAGELAVILVLALLILGPKRLPEMARGIGKFLREFRRQTDDIRSTIETEFYRMDRDLMQEELPKGATPLPNPAPVPMAPPPAAALPAAGDPAPEVPAQPSPLPAVASTESADGVSEPKIAPGALGSTGVASSPSPTHNGEKGEKTVSPEGRWEE